MGDGLRVIFLDIDGVICCNRYGRLEEEKLEALRTVVERTGASVVLSTDWRRTPRLKARLCAILSEYGIRVIGATMQGPPQRPVRPREIVSWLEGYEAERCKQHQSHAPVSDWVAVDDRFLLFEEDGDHLQGHFVHTTFADGLTPHAADRMVDILTGAPGGSASPGSSPAPGTPVGAASDRRGRGVPPPTAWSGGGGGGGGAGSGAGAGAGGFAPNAQPAASAPMDASAASSQRAVLRDARAECSGMGARALGSEASVVLGAVSRVPLRSSSSLGTLHTGSKRLGMGGPPHSSSALSLSMQGQSASSAAAAGAMAAMDLESAPSSSSLLVAHEVDSTAAGASAAASPTGGLPPHAAPWSSASALPSLGGGGALQPPVQAGGYAAAPSAHGHHQQPPQPMAARRAARSTPPSVSLLRHRIKLEQLKDEHRQQLMALEPHNGQVIGRPDAGLANGLANGGSHGGGSAAAKASALYAAPTAQLSTVGGPAGPNNENQHMQMDAHSSKDPRRDPHGGFHTPSIYTADRGYTSATSTNGGFPPQGTGSAISASLKGGNAGNAAAYARAQRFMRRTGSRNGGPPTPTPFQNVKVFDLNVSGAAVGA